MKFKYYDKIIINPKISIFLPVYNKAKYLYRSIGSIQKQTFKEIEIVPVNDCSKDNSLEILIQISKNDKRVKIINNSENKGLFYSRAMGIINSKGDYLMNLDPDDELNGSNCLEFLYNIINRTKVDIISFGISIKSKFKSKKLLKYSNFGKIYYQPEIFNSASKVSDYLIYNKLIRKELFIKVYNLIKEKLYGEKWNYGEDEIYSSLVLKNANSMIRTNKIILNYYINNDSIMRNRVNILNVKNLITWIEMFEIIYSNREYKKFLFSRFSDLVKIFLNNNLLYILKSNEDIKNKYINIFKNMILKYHFNNTNLIKLLNSLQN